LKGNMVPKIKYCDKEKAKRQQSMKSPL